MREVKWAKRVQEFIQGVRISVPVWVDNESCIALARHEIMTQRTKHLDVKYHFVRAEWLCKSIEVRKVPSLLNRSDPLTKPMPGNRVRSCGVVPLLLN